MENTYDSDQDVSEHHSKLLEAVEQLDKGQRVKKAERSEPTLEVSEYHLVRSGITNKDAVHVRDLARTLGQKGYQNEITKKFQRIQQKTKVIPKQLEKPAAERIKRRVGFDNVLKDLARWNAVVAANRAAAHLYFPLKTPKESVVDTTSDEYVKRSKLKSDLEKKLEELDPKPQEPPVENKDKYQKSLEEVVEERKKAARFRAQQSYREAKAHRERKIKSKKFHRIQRKEKTKQQLKEFEELQKTDPEKALAKLQQLDRSRAEERMSLRHKSAGKWAKNKQIRAKYDRETRKVLAEQLAIGRELTQKVQRRGDETDDENEEINMPLVSNNDQKNPSVNNIKTESEVDIFVETYRKYCEKNKKSQQEKVAKVEHKFNLPAKEIDSNESEKQNFEPSKADNTVISTNKKTRKSVATKKVNKKNTQSIIVSDEIVLEENKLKLRDKKKKTKRKASDEADATSTRQVEQCKKKMKTKPFKSEDIDDMFDSLEKKTRHKVDLKLKKVKKNLKTMSEVKTKKRKKENKDDSSNLEFKESKNKPILDLPLDETTSKDNLQRNAEPTNLKALANTEQPLATNKSKDRATEIEVQKTVKPKHLNTQLPDVDMDDENAMENLEQGEEFDCLMTEAFADDDAAEEFRKEKEEEIKKSQPEDIDLYLPGWGTWAGTNIKQNKAKRKQKQFILKFPKDAPRKDENKGNVIIFEGNNEELKEHLVSELPYPFTSVKDFEASIRAPLGRTFIPENAHARLIEPAVNTKIGKVIKPITEDVLVKKQPTLKRRINNTSQNIAKKSKKKRKQNVIT